MDNEVIHYRLLVYSVTELLFIWQKSGCGHRHDTLAALPVGDTVPADDIFDKKLHKPCSCTLPAGCPRYRPAQAKNYAGTPRNSPGTETCLFPQAGWQCSPPSSEFRVLFCQPFWRYFSRVLCP